MNQTNWFADMRSPEAIKDWYAICEFAPDPGEPATKKCCRCPDGIGIFPSMNYVATYGANQNAEKAPRATCENNVCN
ncbi:MAG: hypothetical protein ACYCX2_03325 [Christensenellales bacterium]